MHIIMGVPGAGKSTVLDSFLKKHADWKSLNFGTLMMETASKYGIKDRDSLRKAPQKIQKKIQSEVGAKLSKIKEDEKIILDTHASIKTEKGYLPGLPFSLLSKLNAKGVILITAPLEQILKRRETDKTRIRDKENVESISEQHNMNVYYLASYSAVSGATASIIKNEDGKVENAVKQLEGVLL